MTVQDQVEETVDLGRLEHLTERGLTVGSWNELLPIPMHGPADLHGWSRFSDGPWWLDTTQGNFLMPRTIQVIGPAYLDRVLRVDGPLHAPGQPPLDQSVDGAWTFGPGLTIRDPAGSTLTIEPPKDWPGPTGDLQISGPLEGLSTVGHRRVQGDSWHDDLGGMGAGYASAFGGHLLCALGGADDPLSDEVLTRLRHEGIRHEPIRVAGTSADWTMLLTSGPHGDKLPIGFRGCHHSLNRHELLLKLGPATVDLRVVAAIENRLAGPLLSAPGAALRFFAPTIRNVVDRSEPVGKFARFIDVLCCNRREWERLDDREAVAWQVAVLAVTNGPHGSVVRFTTPDGEAGRFEIPALPRANPPRDTNRAGEAYAATLVSTLLDNGLSNPAQGIAPSLVRLAAERASAAAALVLDRVGFGFPTPEEVDDALRAGRVE